MVAASNRVVTVFGETGFLGRRIVRHPRLHGFYVQVTSRHPDRGDVLLGPDDPQLKCYADYYKKIRTHRSLDKDAPAFRPVQQIGKVASQALLGGLHHHYVRI